MVLCEAEAHCSGMLVVYESTCWEDENEERVAGTWWYRGGATQADPCNEAVWKQVYFTGRQWQDKKHRGYAIIDTLLFKQEELL